MDISGGISNLLQNRLFLQYLSGAGGAMASGQPVAPALNQITQQNIGAQSQAALNKRYMEMISGMLSGEKVPAGGKVIHDEKGTKLEIPKDMGVTGAMGTPGIAGIIGAMGTPASMNLPAVPDLAQVGNINPFQPSQPGISAADLAGLGPQDVSRALGSATSVEALKQQSINNMLRLYEASHGPLEQKFPVQTETGDTLTVREWNTLPAAEKEFLMYLRTAKKLGAPKEELTREFFETLEPTEREKFVRSAMEDPALMAAAKELAEAGRTQISIGQKVAGKVAEKKALSKLKGQLYFDDPEWIDDLSKCLSSEDMQREIFMESQREGGDPGLMKAEKAIKFIEDKISVGGTIQDVKLSKDGKTMIWTVEWKSGDVEDISYVIKP